MRWVIVCEVGVCKLFESAIISYISYTPEPGAVP